MGQMLPLIGVMVGIVAVISLVGFAVGKLLDHSEEGDAGFGPLYGEQGLISGDEPESGPPLRDRGR